MTYDIEDAYADVAHAVIDTTMDELHDRPNDELRHDATHAYEPDYHPQEVVVDPRIGIMHQWINWFKNAIDNLDAEGICPHGNFTGTAGNPPVGVTGDGSSPAADRVEPCEECDKILALFS